MSDNSTAQKTNDADIQRLMGVVSDAMTDGMVERMASTYGNLMEIADHLSEPDTLSAVHSILDELTTLHRTGGLTSLFELLHFINAMRNATTDSIVERGAEFVEHMVNNLASEEVISLAANATSALREAAKDTAQQPHSGGLFATLGMLTKPGTQASLHFLLNFAQRLQKSV